MDAPSLGVGSEAWQISGERFRARIAGRFALGGVESSGTLSPRAAFPEAQISEERSRNALENALGRRWRLALAGRFALGGVESSGTLSPRAAPQ